MNEASPVHAPPSQFLHQAKRSGGFDDHRQLGGHVGCFLPRDGSAERDFGQSACNQLLLPSLTICLQLHSKHTHARLT